MMKALFFLNFFFLFGKEWGLIMMEDERVLEFDEGQFIIKSLVIDDSYFWLTEI